MHSLIAAILFGLVAASLAEYRLVCYYTNWAQYRLTKGDRIGYPFYPEDLPPDLCTHVIFSFAYLADKNGVVELDKREWNDFDGDAGQPGMYTKFNALKKRNPKLKTLLAVGGWNHPADLFTRAASTTKTRAALATSVINILRMYNFDGFDLDWEYPGSRQSPAEDKEKFTDLVKDLRKWFNQEATKTGRKRLLLTAAVGAGKATIDAGYEIGEISKHLDFINLMSYDLHGSWEATTNSNAPLFARSTESEFQQSLNVRWAAQYWKDQVLAAGEPASKITLGMASYGQSYTLKDPNNHGIGASSSGAGKQGVTTLQDGFLAYFEICQMGGVRVYDEEQQFPYRYSGNQWVSFDDMQSLKEKVAFLKSEGFGGAMFWALDLDDFKGKFCGQGKYPLINFVKESLKGNNPTVQVTPSGPNPEVTGPKPDGTGPTGCGNGGNGNGNDGNGSSGNEKPSSGFTCKGKADGVYPMPENCNKFHHCFLGKDHLKDCQAGLKFDSRALSCTWPAQSDCKN